ncbi:MAG: molecular chaperone TorD family protein [Phycisphaerales bacterium]|nr:molecular chaperone TorD family protein [Phycisphaerales bacterium]
MTAATQSLTTDDLAARAMFGVALSHAWRDPMTRAAEGPIASPEELEALRGAWRGIVKSAAELEMSELSLGELTPQRAAIEPLIDWLGAPKSEQAEVFDSVFGLVVSKDCPPYETDYCHWEDPTYRASQMADVGGFYRAFGVQPGGDRPERPDHVATELEFVALLHEKMRIALAAGEAEHAQICREALDSFVRDHAGWWMPTFARCVQRRIERHSDSQNSTPPRDLVTTLVGIGDLLRAWAAVLRTDAGVPASREIIAPNPPSYRPEEEDDACSSCGLHPAEALTCGQPAIATPKGA